MKIIGEAYEVADQSIEYSVELPNKKEKKGEKKKNYLKLTECRC